MGDPKKGGGGKLTKMFVLVLLLAGGAVAGWWFWPAKKVDIKLADKELKKGDDFPHELWTAFLKKHSKDGFVNYAAVKADPSGLEAYLGYIAKYSPQSHPELFEKREDQMAYALNAYNAYIVKGVIDHYPVDSVKKIGVVPYDFFKKFEYPFGPKSWSLEAWETWARGAFNEPRLHFAFNCASLGCPRLPEEAFTPGDLEKQLAREAKKFVTDERNVRVDGGTVHLSSIFKWYRGDFESWQETKGKAKDLLGYVREVGGTAPEKAEIQFIEYDWSLNDRK